MICSSCNIYIPTSRPVYCCIDKTFCSTSCSKKQLTIIQSNDPCLDNPHNWNHILDNNSELNDFEENEIEFIIGIKRNKTKHNIFINMENIHIQNNETKHAIKKYTRLIRLNKLIKNALFINIICKYKIHIMLFLLYIVLLYAIYNAIIISYN